MPKPNRVLRWIWRGTVAGLLFTAIVGALILTRASFISADHLYTTASLSEEVELQLQRMEHIVHRSASKERLDIYADYSEICGEGPEWDYGFYTFYALCLDALVRHDPERLPYAREQIDLCTRLMLQLPIEADDASIRAILDERDDEFNATLVSGYQCLVLGIRRALVGDDLYDDWMLGMSTALEEEIFSQLQRAASVYTSDQSTQLHAIWRVDQALGSDRTPLFDAWMATMQDKFIDEETGMLHSMVSIAPDRIDSPARTTSVAWSIIFLRDLFPEFAEQQAIALHEDRLHRVGSLTALSEFPEINPLNFGDMDSGPILLGISPAATGFGLSSLKLYGSKEDYTRVYRIFEMFGLPKTDEDGKYHYMGNGMGDAILLYSKIIQP